MDPIYLFAMVMVLFWIFVQQVCLCCIKWAYEDILGHGERIKKYAAINIVIFMLCVLYAFDQQLGIDVLYNMFHKRLLFAYHRFRWNFFCGAMLVLDSLLLMYALRIYKLFMSSNPRPASRLAVFTGDCLVGGAFFAFFLVYHWGMGSVFYSHWLSVESHDAIQFFYIKIANFFYAFFEGMFAVLLWRIYRVIKQEEVRA